MLFSGPYITFISFDEEQSFMPLSGIGPLHGDTLLVSFNKLLYQLKKKIKLVIEEAFPLESVPQKLQFWGRKCLRGTSSLAIEYKMNWD